MKLSNKLVKKLTSFAETYKDLNKMTSDVKEDIEEMKELVKEGAESQITNFSKKSSVVARKFSAIIDNMKNKVEDASVATEEFCDQAEKDSKEDPSIKAFARKAKIIKRSFADLEQKFVEANEAAAAALSTKVEDTSVKESVVAQPMPGTDPNADPTKTNVKVSPNPPTEGAEVVDPAATNKAESVNFTKVEFYKFNLGNALTAFAEFAEELKDMGDLVDEVVEIPTVSEEPAAPKAEVSEVTPTSEELPKNPKEEMIEDSVDKLVADMIIAGKDAIKSDDKDAMNEISKAATELEEKAPGKGEEVVTAIENFAKEFNMNKNFSKQEPAKAPVCSKCGKDPCECTPEFTEQQQALIDKAMKAFAAKDKVAAEEVAKAAQELENTAPGQGEQVISFIETKVKNFSVDLEKVYKTYFEGNLGLIEEGNTFDECVDAYKEDEGKAPEDMKLFEKVYKELTSKKNFHKCPNCGKELCECDSEAKDKLVEAGIKAFANQDKDAMNKVAEDASKIKGGEDVIDTIENFATLYKLGFGKISKNFGTDNFGVIGAVKELIGFAADKIISGEKFDVADISTKAEDLENQLPGAGEVVVSTIENFNSIAKATEKKMTPETEEEVVKNFSDALEAFVSDIPVADKAFAHKIKKACFEALEACDAKDTKKVKEFCNSVSKAFANVEIADEKIKNFCDTVGKFCKKFSAFDKVDTIPADIAEKDAQLNTVLDTIEEKSAQLPATAQPFAKQMCAFCKGVKCNSEDKLDEKLAAIESIKKSFSEAGVDFEKSEAPVAKTEEPKTEPAAPNAESTTEEPKAEVAANAEEPKTEPKTEPAAPAEPAPATVKDKSDELIAQDGDKDYDPTGENAPVEETPASAEAPADSDVVIPSHFSQTEKGYESTFDHLTDLVC